MNNRRVVTFINYSDTETLCKCGCGAQTKDLLMTNLQAFLFILQNVYGQVRHRISSGARCSKHNLKVGGSPSSQHLLGLAVDGNFDRRVSGKWQRIPTADIAALALASRLFTGIGWKMYDGKFIHLDTRDGAAIATW